VRAEVTEAVMKFANRDGVKLAYLDEGVGDPALLFIHGWSSDHTFWRDQIPEFQKRHRVVAVDLRGLGESDAPDEDATIGQFTDDIAWLSRKIGLDKPVIVGHSMGGLIAFKFVQQHQEMARAAVIVDTPLLPLTDEIKGRFSALVSALQSPGYKDVITSVAKNLFGADAPAEIRDYVAERMAAAPQRHMHTAMASSFFSDENIPKGDIPVPSLSILSKMLAATKNQLRERYPGMEVTTVDCGHAIQMEKPEEFNRIVREFVEGLP
jgi:pimeloyl-ACP methyl ester carboxylesterase